MMEKIAYIILGVLFASVFYLLMFVLITAFEKLGCISVT